MQSTIQIEINDNVYTVKYPTVGQVIAMKSRELELSKGQLKDLLFSTLGDDTEVLVAIKAVAAVETLLPSLVRDLKVDNILDLDYGDFQIIQKEYVAKILPWLNDWSKNIREKYYGKEE